MKRIIFSIWIIICMVLFFANVDAANLNVNLLGEATIQNETTIYVQVGDLTDFSTKNGGLCGLVAKLSYDETKLEVKSIKALQKFTLVQGDNIVIYKSTGVSSGTKVLEITLKNKALKDDEKTTISLTGIVASDGEKDISAKDVTKTLAYGIKESNKIEDKKEENSNVEDLKESGNNYLTNITLSTGNLTFNKNIQTYNISVDNDVNSIEINAVTEDAKSTLLGRGTYSLSVGNNKIELTVKAEDGTERTYTINVTRKADEQKADNIVLNPIEDNKNESKSDIFLWLGILAALLIVVICGVIFAKRR